MSVDGFNPQLAVSTENDCVEVLYMDHTAICFVVSVGLPYGQPSAALLLFSCTVILAPPEYNTTH